MRAFAWGLAEVVCMAVGGKPESADAGIKGNA